MKCQHLTPVVYYLIAVTSSIIKTAKDSEKHIIHPVFRFNIQLYHPHQMIVSSVLFVQKKIKEKSDPLTNAVMNIQVGE